MAVREFDGTDDFIRMAAGGVAISNFAQGNYTVLALVKPTTNSGTEIVVGISNGGTWLVGLGQEASNIGLADDVNVYMAAVTRATVWEVVAITKAAGTTSIGVHRKALGSGSWEHTNTGATTTAGVAGTPNQIDISGVNGGSFSSFKDMRLATAAVFNKVLSNGEIEGIETALSTQSIYDLTPVALWDFNQASTATPVDDLMGGGADESAITGTTVVTTDDPSGWTFGIGGGGGGPTQRFIWLP